MASQVDVRFYVLSPGWSSGSCVYRRISPFDAWGNRNGTRATHQNDAGEFMKIFFWLCYHQFKSIRFPFQLGRVYLLFVTKQLVPTNSLYMVER